MSQTICVTHVLATDRSFSWVYQTLRVFYLMDAMIVWNILTQANESKHLCHPRVCNWSFIFLSLRNCVCLIWWMLWLFGNILTGQWVKAFMSPTCLQLIVHFLESIRYCVCLIWWMLWLFGIYLPANESNNLCHPRACNWSFIFLSLSGIAWVLSDGCCDCLGYTYRPMSQTICVIHVLATDRSFSSVYQTLRGSYLMDAVIVWDILTGQWVKQFVSPTCLQLIVHFPESIRYCVCLIWWMLWLFGIYLQASESNNLCRPRACNWSFIFFSLSDIAWVLSDGSYNCLGIYLQANESKHLCHPRAWNQLFIFLSVSDIACVLSDGCYDCLEYTYTGEWVKAFVSPTCLQLIVHFPQSEKLRVSYLMDAVIIWEYTYRPMSESIYVTHVLATDRSFSWVYQILRVSYLMDAVIVWDIPTGQWVKQFVSPTCLQLIVHFPQSVRHCVGLIWWMLWLFGIYLQASESNNLCHPRACNWSFIFLSLSDTACVLSDGCCDCLGYTYRPVSQTICVAHVLATDRSFSSVYQTLRVSYLMDAVIVWDILTGQWVKQFVSPTCLQLIVHFP